MTNRSPVDWWTLVHAGVGAAMGAAGVPVPWTVVLLTGYEVAEHAIEYPNGSELFGTKAPESPSNVAMDLGVALVAYSLARAAGERRAR